MLTETMMARAVGRYQTNDSYVSTSPLHEVDLATTGGPNAHILVTGVAREQPSLSVTRDEAEGNIGRVLAVRPSHTGAFWYYLDGHARGTYFVGALINPPLVNGHYYRELLESYSAENEGEQYSPYLLRYNDGDHVSDRRVADYPFTIVDAAPSQRTQIGSARWITDAPTLYVEVNWGAPDAEVGIDQIFNTPDAPDPDEELPVGYIENTSTSHTLGMAHAEDNGQALLDPDRTTGEAYIVWRDNRDWYDDHAMLQQWTGDEWVALGYYHRGVNGTVYYTDDAWYPALLTTTPNVHWAKAALTERPAADDVDARISALEASLNTDHEAFEDLNDELNEVAREQSWCGQYERSMEEIGMRDRHTERTPYGVPPGPSRHAYDIEVAVDFTAETDYPGSSLTSALEYQFGFSGNVREVRFDASANITVYGVIAASEEDARDALDSSQVEDALDATLSISSVSIDDYEITDVTEDEDYDWDD